MEIRVGSRLVLATAVAVLSAQASAQERAVDSAVRSTPAHPRRATPILFAVIGGPGVETPTPYLFESDGNIYQTQKRPVVFEIEVSKTLFSTRGRRTFVEYFIAVQPAVSIGGNIQYRFGPCLNASCFRSGVGLVERRYTSFGVGATPFGGRMTTSLPFGARLSASLGAGVVVLNRAIPYDKAKRFNFQFTARPALGIPMRHFGTFWAGYEIFHISNANTSPINPGINGGLVMFGFQRGR